MEELFAIPDFVPLAWEVEYLEQARLQVLTTCHQRELAWPDPGLQRAATNGWLATWRTGFPLSWLPTGETTPAAITLLRGWAGLVALTVMWLWLAVTHDVIWWWFTAVQGLNDTQTAAVAEESRHLPCGYVQPSRPWRGW